MPFSVVILTKNEEINLDACLDSLQWCDDVVILDSYSDDRTVEIAHSRGHRVFQRRFDNFGAQRNFALDEVDFKHRWLFHLDADERFNEKLRAECERVIQLDELSGYFVPNRIIFLGKWIKRCTQYPHPQVRLIKRGEVRFAAAGHGQREDQVERGLGHIKIPYDHFNFSKGIEDWVEKHNRYSTAEARSIYETEPSSVSIRSIFSTDKMARRRALKRIHNKLPFRYVTKFVYLYLLRLGILDGYPGFAYCLLQSFYELLIVLKLAELRQSDSSSRRNLTDLSQ